MQTTISEKYKHTAAGKEADSILRSCVHCGFCTATCPTYQLLGDELDGPRGRIYLIKQLLEDNEATRKTQLHLDRCLTCRSCETTCPSGVRYARLADIGRDILEREVKRPAGERLKRRLLRFTLPHSQRFGLLLKLGQLFRPVLPASLKQKVPPRRPASPWPTAHNTRRMLVLEGCVQPSTTPNTNAAAARVLNRLGINLTRADNAGCCGAVSYHLSAHEEGLDFIRRNIDAWWPHIESGTEAIVMTASGCGAMVKEYGELLKHDPAYATKAARVSELTKDISEILNDENLDSLNRQKQGYRVAVHSPCTLQHGQKIIGLPERILQKVGFVLTTVTDSHLCCGSAGTYSILQTELSQQLLSNKLAALQGDKPACIVTSNIGCQLHMETRANIPVKHWIELLDEA